MRLSTRSIFSVADIYLIIILLLCCALLLISTEFDLNNFEFEQTARKTDYSQGLKLVDLVAETDSLQISEGEL